MRIDSNECCAICEELSASPRTRLSGALSDDAISNAILTTSDHFAVIPSVGPLVLGHSLVVTREHSNNVIASLSDYESHDLRNICECSMTVLLDRCPGLQLLCFEHGSKRGPRHSLCSTSHGHIHLVPLSTTDAMAVLDSVGGQGLEVQDFHELSDSIGRMEEYIVAFCLMQDRDELRGVIRDASHVPSQYLRRLVADRLGIAAWDWKTNANADLLRRTLALGFEPNKKVTLHPMVRTI